MEAKQTAENDSLVTKGEATRSQTHSAQTNEEALESFERQTKQLLQRTSEASHSTSVQVLREERLLTVARNAIAQARQVYAEKADLLTQDTSTKQYLQELMQLAKVGERSSSEKGRRELRAWIQHAAQNANRTALHEELSTQSLRTALSKLRTALELKLQSDCKDRLDRELERSRILKAAAAETTTPKLKEQTEAFCPTIQQQRRLARLSLCRCQGLAIAGRHSSDERSLKQAESPYASQAGLTAQAFSKQVMQLQLELQQKDAQLRTLQSSLLSMSNKLAATEIAAKDADDKCAQILKRNAELIAKAAQTEIQMSRSRTASILNASSNQRIDQLRAQVEQITKELDAAQRSLVDQKEQTEKWRIRQSAAHQSLENERKVVVELEHRVDSLKQKVESEQLRCANLAEGLLKEQQTRLIDVQCLHDSLEQEKNLNEDLSRELVSTRAKLESALTRSAQSDVLSQEVEKLRKQTESLKLELLQLRNKQTAEELRHSQEQCQALELKRLLDAATKSHQAESLKGVAAAHQLEEWRCANAELTRSLNQATAVNNVLKEEIRQLQVDITSCRHKTTVLEEERDRAVASVAACNQDRQSEYQEIYERWSTAENALLKTQDAIHAMEESLTQHIYKRDAAESQLAAAQKSLEATNRERELAEAQNTASLLELSNQHAAELQNIQSLLERTQRTLEEKNNELEAMNAPTKSQIEVRQVVRLEDGSTQTQQCISNDEAERKEHRADTTFCDNADIKASALEVIEIEETSLAKQGGANHQAEPAQPQKSLAEQHDGSEQVSQYAEAPEDSTVRSKENEELQAQTLTAEEQGHSKRQEKPKNEIVAQEALLNSPRQDMGKYIEEPPKPGEMKNDEEPATIQAPPANQDSHMSGDVIGDRIEPDTSVPTDQVQQPRVDIPPIPLEELNLPAELQPEPVISRLDEQPSISISAQESLEGRPSLPENSEKEASQHSNRDEELQKGRALLSQQQKIEYTSQQTSDKSVVGQPIEPQRPPLEQKFVRAVPPPFFMQSQEDSRPKLKQEMPAPADTEGILDEPVSFDLSAKTTKVAASKPKKKKTKVSKKILAEVIRDATEDDPES